MNELINFLDNQDVEYKRNQKLSIYSSIKIGGSVGIIIFPNSIEKAINTLRFLVDNNIGFSLVGNMTNVLPSDIYDVGKVFFSTLKLDGFRSEGEIAECGSGILFSKVILNMLAYSYGGSESLYLIPGTVGGMLVSNAGAYGDEISDNLVSVCVFDKNSKKVINFDKNELKFSYRYSSLKNPDIVILSAKFLFARQEKNIIEAKLRCIRKARLEKQPLSLPNIGSVFKKSGNFAASFLIDQCGLKGRRVGDIAVSEKHAGFFVNLGSGSSSDFKELSAIVKEKVYNDFGVLLTEEIVYI